MYEILSISCMITDVIFMIFIQKKYMLSIFSFKLLDLFYFSLSKYIQYYNFIQSNSIYNAIYINIIEY